MPKTYTTRPYSKVVRDMWGDDRFKKLSVLKPSGQALWVYLLTGPHCTVIPGLAPELGIGTLVDRLKWKDVDVRRCWSEIERQQLAEADWDAGVIWLPNGYRHNEPANPNVVTAWRNVTLPQCDLVSRALASLRKQLWTSKGEAKGKDWVKAFDDVFWKGFPEAILAGFPEGFGEGIGDTETEAGSVTERTPQPPSARGAVKVSQRKPTSKELERAEATTRAWGRCQHKPTCRSMDICWGRLIFQWRLDQANGIQQQQLTLVEAVR